MSPETHERLQIPGRHDMFGALDGVEALDHLESLGVDHVDFAGGEIGRIDPRQLAGDRGAEHAGARAGIDVLGIDRGGHRQIGRRQVDRLLGTELIGGERDEIALGAALFGHAATEGGASRGVRASRRNGQRLRRVEAKFRTDDGRQRQSRRADPSAQLHHCRLAVMNPACRTNSTNAPPFYAPTAMTDR